MNNIFKLFSAIIILSLSGLLYSCGNSDSPVDRLTAIIDKATEQVKDSKSNDALENIQSAMVTDGAEALIKDNANYELTNSDKNKLKKSMEKLVKAAFEKSISYYNFDESVKKNLRSQIDMAVAGINTTIDQAKTLGEIGFPK